MSFSSLPPDLRMTIIVATTPNLGIGLDGSLPWPSLKPDLQFFSRVTKRSPPGSAATHNTQNALLMGRKTYFSIPPRFRPLPARINVVLTRSSSSLLQKEEKILTAESIPSALSLLYSKNPHRPPQDHTESNVAIGRIFIIGGSELYATALKDPRCDRVLWTRVGKEYGCDTFFPGGVLGEEERNGWRKSGEEEWREWIGEEGLGRQKLRVKGQGEEEEEVDVEWSMWTREGDGVG
ncbi:MAG: hypothetical protein Q9190_002101 [Brigantiaea leucoxantha]